MKNGLLKVLREVGKPLDERIHPDGSELLLLPFGARVLGLFAPGSDQNFFWTHPALESESSARSFFQSNDWPNTGGDRTWLAPEVDVFFPEYPDTTTWRVPAALDPGAYTIQQEGAEVNFTAQISLTLSRCRREISARIRKSWGPVPNPLRHERVWNEIQGVAFAGYSQETHLELLSRGETSVGLWSLLAVPNGGEVLIPTYSRTHPEIYSGTVSAADLVVTEHLVRFRAAGAGIRKIGVRAVASTGRLGYLYPSGDEWSLIIRNFILNPSGEYVDVPWQRATDLDARGFSTQACSVQNELGDYCELEYHTPAVGMDADRPSSHDSSDIWAFHGAREAIVRLGRELLSPEL